MKLAWKEICYGKKKYLLIELVIVLLMFMVLFLSGMANGLGRAVSSGIEEMNADYFILDDSAEELITVSNLSEDVFSEVKGQTTSELATLDIQRMYIKKAGQEEKINITYFAIEAGSFLEPAILSGEGLSASNVENPIVLDDDFQIEGISIGDIVEDSASEIEFTVVGFAKDQMYGHTSIGFITQKSYDLLRKELSPYYETSYHAIALRGDDISKIDVNGAVVIDKQTIIKNIPSYQAENLTITMIVWTLVIVSAIIIGIFFYIMTMQKEKQFAVMKSLGVSMSEIAGMICAQIGIIAVFGALVANALNLAMAAALPQKMPYYLHHGDAIMVSVVFVIISLISSVLSVRKVAKVDPMMVIGGEQ